MKQVAAMILAGAAALGMAAAASGQTVDLNVGEPETVGLTYGMQLRPVDRATVYEFAPGGEPAMRRVGRDSYQITFESKAACDATVVIENAAGRIVRHMASGVLGANAPAPFAKNSLRQTLAWDGKNDLEEYVRDVGSHTVRVSLGLKPTLDRIIGWHPKDTTNYRRIGAIGSDERGVYTFEPSMRPKVKLFGHDAKYVRTVVPVAAETIGQADQKIPQRTLPDGRRVPALVGEMGQAPFNELASDMLFCRMAIANGWIVLPSAGNGAGGWFKKLIRFRTDGTTGGLNPIGKQLAWTYGQFIGHCELCMSPDGKWIYASGLPNSGDWRSSSVQNLRNCVMRFAFDDTATLGPQDDSFVGELARGRGRTGAGNDAKHLSEPKGIATDAAGNLYVCDYGNDRIQVFSPDARLLKSIPFKRPREITVNPKNGQIYVLSFNAGDVQTTANEEGSDINIRGGDTGFTVTKLAGLADPKPLWEKRFEEAVKGRGVISYWPIFTVDFWSDPVRVWVVRSGARIQVYDEKGDGLTLYDDFIKDVADTGLRPQMIGYYKMSRLAADPVRDLLYMARTFNWCRVNPEEGKRWETIKLFPGYTTDQEMDCGYDGLIYARTLTQLARFDPDKLGRNVRKPNSSSTWDLFCAPSAEVTFDYGEELKDLGAGQVLRGALTFPAQRGANSFDTGFDVSANGKIVLMVKNIQKGDFHQDIANKGGWTLPPLEEDRFRPSVYPGRPWHYEELVWVYDRRGELLHDDLIGGLPANSEGVRMDLAGNVYVGVGYHQNVGGKPHPGGAVAAFTPKGGRFVCEEARPVKMDPLPNAPADYLDGAGRSRTWAVNMQWSYPGYDQVFYVDPVALGYPCLCANCRFDADPFGRCFIPKAYQYTVGIVDAAGNRLCEVGRYGNADSGRGAESTDKAEADSEISLAGCSYVATVSDRWLYLMDDGNGRIVRVRLGYHAERRIAVPAE